jgi:hypothetical protein
MKFELGPLKNWEAVLNENLPHIFSGTAVVGVVTTSVMAAKAWEKIKSTYKESEKTAEEKTKIAIKELIPVITSGAITIACIVYSDIIHTERYGALLTAYAAVKTEIPKAKETLMLENKNSGSETIEDKTAKSTGAYVMNDVKIYRVVDLETGYEFNSSVALLKDAEKTVEKQIHDEGGASLENFYNIADYSRTDRWLPNIAESIRWESGRWNDEHIELCIQPELDDTGEVYLTISYNHE